LSRKIKEVEGVWATGKILEQCRENFKDVIEGWILLSLKKGLPIPKLEKSKWNESSRLI